MDREIYLSPEKKAIMVPVMSRSSDLQVSRGPWRNLDAVGYATLEWVDWSNHRRLLEPIGNVPRRNSKCRIINHTVKCQLQHDSNPELSGKAGAVQLDLGAITYEASKIRFV